MFPTFVEIAGGKLPGEIDAISLLPMLKGDSEPSFGSREAYFVRREGGPTYGGLAYHALIQGNWKMLRNDSKSSYQLYNLAADPYEVDDLASSHATRIKRMKSALQLHVQQGGQTNWQSPPQLNP